MRSRLATTPTSSGLNDCCVVRVVQRRTLRPFHSIETAHAVINFCYSCNRSQLGAKPMRVDFPSLRQLRAFEAVARCKSIGAGARELGLSQPAVTHMIAQLETVLAVSLLERRRSGSFLTPLGSVLLPRVARVFALIQSTLRDPVIGASL